MLRVVGVCALLLIGFLAAAGMTAKSFGQTNAASKVQYNRDIQPILSSNCFTCHGPDQKNRKAGLRLDLAAAATKELKSGSRAIVPGDAKGSELVVRIFTSDSDRMPPAKSQHQLSQREKELLKRWVQEGAEYQPHWAFVAPKRPPLPSTRKVGWANNAIDHFVLAGLEAEGLSPSPEADRFALARRVALDLTGLPPTLDEADRFVRDTRPDAFEKFVDRVMAKPSFGERWAQVWLDLARYADSNGYANDNPRTIWKYRDWVIDALNANMPFDRFTVEQLAGDLLPWPTPEQILATAFNRNTLTNDEGGVDHEEFRVAAVVDRVNTTMQVWMGLTFSCAQCHDHKYDPVSQEEYFRLYAIFNQTEDSDRSDNNPVLLVGTPADLKRKADLEAEIARLEIQLNAVTLILVAAQKKWEAETKVERLPAKIQTILLADPGRRTKQQQDDLTKYFRSQLAEFAPMRSRLDAAKKELTSIKAIPTPIMRELPPTKARKSAVHIRGNFLDHGKEVLPGVPALFPPLPQGTSVNRLALAKWLVDSGNPLTARVAVNRLWEQIFGIGLVDTPEDWGIRAKVPAQMDLLDWLATEFVATNWDVNQMLKLMVASAAYRQSSKVTPALLERDPDNRLLARGPRFRISAEAIRDQALFASGLLSPALHGEPVRPPRPKMKLKAAFGGATDWEDSTGDDKYRRGLYTLWRRTTPYPSMTTFDAPSRNVCTVVRPRTNTPLQALVTLNDPAFVEAAQGLARRVLAEGGKSVAEKTRYAFRLCLIRPPHEIELNRLIELYEKARADYAGKSKEATTMATVPRGPLPAGMDPVDAAAWTVVANVLLNLDEMVLKR
jgi:mono/diheme cytochrome c family protein